MFKDSKREDLEQDYDYARDRLLGAMAKTLELLLSEHVSNHPAQTAEDARSVHKATTLLGGLGYCIEHFSEAEQKLRSYRRG